jgi:hypothetical protein
VGRVAAKISPNLQHLTDELPADSRKDVEEAIASSPYLRQIMTEAANAGTLEHIRLGVPGANESGHYDKGKRAIYLSADTFTDPVLKQDRQQLLDVVTSTLGHETGHALYAEKAGKELGYTSYTITEGVRSAGPGGEFDATGLVGAYIRDARRNEAQAEMHGWDALASRIEHLEGKPPSMEVMLRRADVSTDCVDSLKKGGHKLASGIILDADMHMSDTRLPKAGPINLEPVAKCHFDNPRTSLGAAGKADYTNYYGAYLVQQLADDTRHWVNPPTIKLDMEKLGLDKTQLESTGLRLGNDGFSLIDTSRGTYNSMTLRSKGTGIQGTPEPEQPVAQQVGAPSLLSETSHPAHTMYAQALNGLRTSPNIPAGTFTQHEEEKLAAGLVAQALTQQGSFPKAHFDAVVMNNDGTKVIGVQGALDSPANRLAAVDIQQTLSVASIAQSSDVARTAMHSLQQQQALAQVQAETIGVDAPTSSGPVMKIGARTMTPASGPSDGGGGDGGGGGGG